MPPEAASYDARTIPADYAPALALLKGRNIVITGAGDGLGRATALACARHGATVVLLGRTVKKLEAVYDAITASGDPQPAIYPMNLAGASWNDHAELAATLERELGRLDGLVHCAAHFTGFLPLADVGAKEWIESLQVNLTAAFALTRHCLPLLEKSDAASIVFVSDDAGRRSKPFRGAFGVAKAALEAMAQSWAQELETHPHLRVNTYDPGPLRTALRLRGYPGEDSTRLPAPESVSNDLLWLLGRDSRGCSGYAFGRG